MFRGREEVRHSRASARRAESSVIKHPSLPQHSGGQRGQGAAAAVEFLARHDQEVERQRVGARDAIGRLSKAVGRLVGTGDHDKQIDVAIGGCLIPRLGAEDVDAFGPEGGDQARDDAGQLGHLIRGEARQCLLDPQESLPQWLTKGQA